MTGGDEDRAKSRFLVIQIVRLSGVAMVLIALLTLNGVLPLPELAGWVLLPIGLVDIFVVPQILSRMWRSPVP